MLWLFALCAGAAFLTDLILGLLIRVGLGFIFRFVARLVFWDAQHLFSVVIFDKFWFRLALFYFIGALVLALTGPVGLAIAFGGYVWWLHKPKPDPLSPEETTPQPGGFRLDTAGGPLFVNNPYRGVFIAGGAGSGKSKSLIEPIIQQAASNGMAGIVYDFKFPTLAGEVVGSYRGSTVRTYLVNFSDPTRSHRINPLWHPLLTNASFARESAVTVLANLDYKASQARTFWIQSAEVLLTGAIWYLRQRHPEQCSLPHAVSLLLEANPQTLVKTLSQDEQTRGITASVSSAAGSENQLAGVFSTIQNYLSILNSPEIFWVLSDNQVPLDLNNPEKPGILVVGNDPSLTDTFSPLISLIVSTALKRMNQPGRVPSVVILDEAPTLFIPNFQQIPATARSNKMATVYAVQDVAQMEGTLGPQVSEMIISNLSNQFFGRTTNPKTAERVTRLFGKYDKTYETQSQQHSARNSSTGRSYGVQQRDRLEAQEVMRFKTGEFAGLIAEGNQDEFRAQFTAQPSKAEPITPFLEVTPEQIRANYAHIRQQARAILIGEEQPTESATTTSREAVNQPAPTDQAPEPSATQADVEGPTLDDLASMD